MALAADLPREVAAVDHDERVSVVESIRGQPFVAGGNVALEKREAREGVGEELADGVTTIRT